MNNLRLLAAFCAGAFSMSMPTGTNAALVFNVSFDDPTSTFSAYYSDIQSHVFAAGARWDNYIVGDASLEVQIGFSASAPTVNGNSITSSFVRSDGAINIFEQGAAGEINTGIDPNNVAPDIQFTIGTDYLMNEMWFDPDPFNRTATVDSNKTDAVSTFLHEFGHAFAFNGWKNPSDGSLPANNESTFDEHVYSDGSYSFFSGINARNIYGGDVPLTNVFNWHLGNNAPGPGSDLIPDLMNGVSFNRGYRYDISALDVAILKDLGFAVVPIPATAWLFVSGLLGLIGFAKRKRVA